MGRINAWHMAFNLALDHPILGGGLQAFTRASFLLYAPDPMNVHDAHSIYFEVLGEQGFVGLALFVGLGALTLRKGTAIRRATSNITDLKWMRDLATMTQLSVLGYAVAGLFLGLAYFDFYYALVALMVGLSVVLDKERTARPELFSAARSSAPTSIRSQAKFTAHPGKAPQKTPFRTSELFSFALDWYRRL